MPRTDPAQPIPVVFNLSSWTDPKQNLLDWLIEELLAKYQVPKKIGGRWLEANWIVPLLDGLDEIDDGKSVGMREGDQRIRAEQGSAWASRVQPVERVYGFASALARNGRDLIATPYTGAGQGLCGPFGGCLGRDYGKH